MSLYRPPITVLGATQYEYQPSATIYLAPSQNGWYTILDTTTNVLLLWIRVLQRNDETAAKSLRMRISIDGRVLTGSLTSCANWTSYYCYIASWGEPVLTTSEVNVGMYVVERAKSVKVEVQFGDSPGTNQILEGYVQYAKLKATTL